MCDYSLCGVPNRLAQEGEDLVLYRFRTGTVGLASPQEIQPPNPKPVGFWKWMKVMLDGSADLRSVKAVCIPPGAQLRLKDIPESLQKRWHLDPEENVVFLQASASLNTHRDAVRFGNGTQILLHNLPTGIGAEVLSLNGMEAEPEFAHQYEMSQIR